MTGRFFYYGYSIHRAIISQANTSCFLSKVIIQLQRWNPHYLSYAELFIPFIGSGGKKTMVVCHALKEMLSQTPFWVWSEWLNMPSASE